MKTGIVTTVLFALALGVAALLTDRTGNSNARATASDLDVTAAAARAILANPEVVVVDLRPAAGGAVFGRAAPVDKHIPFTANVAGAGLVEGPGRQGPVPNPDFAVEFELFAMKEGLWSDSPIVLVCRKKPRCSSAAELLRWLGYTQILSIVDGHAGDVTASAFHFRQGTA